MNIAIYTSSDKLENLQKFLKKDSDLDIEWSERPFLDYVQVILTLEEFNKLKDKSQRLIEEETQEENTEESVSFWDMPQEQLLEFNDNGLFSLEQMQQAFFAGCEYYSNLDLQERGEIFKDPKNFKEWFNIHFKNGRETL